MKARITSKTYYVAETEDGKKYSVDIRNPQIKHAFDNNLEIEGEIFREEKQDRYVSGEYARSYTIIEKFIPKKEKITLNDTIPRKYKMNELNKKNVIDVPPIIIKEGHSKPKEHISLPKKSK